MNDSFDPHHVAIGSEEDDVTSEHREPCIFADLRAKLIAFGGASDLLNLFPNLANEGNGANRIVLSDPVSDLFQVTLYKWRQFNPHYRFESTIVWYLRSN